ncbi:hypothetical protein BGX27_011122 [Mortierella sp. AM989]|nr:hypothetical protein BGX27_011122 [Mortierella sp. AM989]
MIWRELPQYAMELQAELVCGTILDSLLKYIKPTSKEGSEKIKILKKKLKLDRAFVNKGSGICSILNRFKIQRIDNSLDERQNTVDERLNTKPGILAVKNGVIDLKTGNLRHGLPDDWMSIRLDVEFKGLGSSTKDIDSFVSEIFGNNITLIKYVQRLLGYAITGCSSEHCLVIFAGDGANGKSLLISLILELMNKWCIIDTGDIFFKGNRRALTGGPTPHLAELKGIRICVKEEADPESKLNVETLKTITGESPISARSLHAREKKRFNPTALPILLCNDKPFIDADDNGMLRRIKIIPFRTIFTTVDDHHRPYNAENPRHKLIDPNLREKLLTKSSQEQLLVWLVQGACSWYEHGLGETPRCMVDAFNEYAGENDDLGTFIEDCCEKSSSYEVNAGYFRAQFNEVTGCHISQKELVKKMRKRKNTYILGGLAIMLSVAASAMAKGAQVLTPDTFDSIYDKLTDAFVEYQGKIIIAKVDADEYSTLRHRFGVRGYPTIKWFPNGINSASEDYRGRWNLESLKSFIEKKAGIGSEEETEWIKESSRVEVLTDKSFEEKVHKSGKAYLVEFYAPWCGHCKALAPTIEKVGRDFSHEKNVVIAKIDATAETATAQKYGIDGYPTIKFFGTNGSIREYEGDRTEHAILAFVNKHAGTGRAAGGRLSHKAGRIGRLDEIALRFSKANSPEEKKALRKEGIELATSLKDSDKNALHYVQIFDKTAESPEYLKKESHRLQKLISSNSLTDAKVDELSIRHNILSTFSESNDAYASAAHREEL